MMTKSKSPRIANLKLLLTVPVLIALVFIFSCSSNSESLLEGEQKIEVSSPNAETTTKSFQEADITDTEVAAEIFFVVEEMPEFQGDNSGEKFREYIGKNLKYPEIAVEKRISGRVFVQFVIEEDGTVSNVKIARGVDPILDKEAIRVIKSSLKWKPGKQRGVAVRVQYTFPINFALQ